MYIPQGDQERKEAPMFRGLLGYFPAALFEVAAHSLDSDRKHSPDAPEERRPTWHRGKSVDHADCIVRHLIDAGPRRSLLSRLPAWLLEKMPGSSARDAKRYHLRSLAWRALAMLQEDCEATGSAMGVSALAHVDIPPSEPSPTQGATFEIRDNHPGRSGYQKFAGRTFLDPRAATDAVHQEVDPAYWNDFQVIEKE
jgi:hypothetical protein